MNKKTTLTYLNGYLEAIAMMNSFTNDGKTYEIELLSKIDNDPQKTLCHHLKAAPHEVELEEIEAKWQDVLTNELELYFSQIIVEAFRRARKDKFNDINADEINSFKKDYYFNVNGLIENFLEYLEKLIPQILELYRVKVNLKEGFYECYYHDYLFDLKDEVLFLHFGGSD